MDKENALSREQKLQLFLEVLQSAILRYIWTRENRGPVRRAIRKIQAKKPFVALRDVLFKGMKTQNFFATFDGYAEDYYRDAGKEMTTFAESVQRRIAKDIMEHVLSGNAKSSFDFLFNSSYLWLMGRCANAVRVTDQSGRLNVYLADLISAPDREGMEIIREMVEDIAYPPFTVEPMPFIQKLVAEISHEMIGCLLRLPYFEILKERRP